MWGKILSFIADETLKIYQYELKVTALFKDILSTMSFGNFILYGNPLFSVRKSWLDYYDKAIRAYAYYTLLPCIGKIAGDKIVRDPDLYEYFSNFTDYWNIWERIQREPEADGSDLEGIAKTFRDFFSPIVKGFMWLSGTFLTYIRDLWGSGAYAIWDIAKRKKFDIRSIIETVLQRYRGISLKMRTVNVPPEFYYQQRPTLDFDIVSLLSHVKAYMAYRKLLDQDIEAQKNSPLSKNLQAKLTVDNKVIKTIQMHELMKFNFCLTNEEIDKYKGNMSYFELGGVGDENES